MGSCSEERIPDQNDLKLRLKFAGTVCCKLSANFLEEGEGFFLDGASFAHKMNPSNQARAPRAKAWRKTKQGFDFGFTGKGSCQGTRGAVAHFKAAIGYGKGVIAAEKYHGRTIAETFSLFVHEHFSS